MNATSENTALRPADLGGVARRPDGSFVIRNGMYHVTHGEPMWYVLQNLFEEYPDEIVEDSGEIPDWLAQQEGVAPSMNI